MTTIRALHEDALYAILPHCSASIDMWNLLLALDFPPEHISNLRAFWNQIRLTSPNGNEEHLLAFVKQVAMFTVELRLDHLNWMSTASLRRILSYFRIVIKFHTGSVALSNRTLTHDLPLLFPFLKSVHLLVSPSDPDDDHFRQLCSTLASTSMKQLTHISLLLEDEKKICLSNTIALVSLIDFCDFLRHLGESVRLISIEENFFDFHQRFYSSKDSDMIFRRDISIALPSNVKHLIVHFRPMAKANFILKTEQTLELESLVLPKFPSFSSEKFSWQKLKLVHLGDFNPKNQLDQWLCDAFRSSLRNVTLHLNETTPIDLIINENDNELLFQFSSTIQMKIPFDFVRYLTNLNLTGIHCHSMNLQLMLDELQTLQSLSLSPCSFFYVDQTSSEKILRFKRNLLAFNLVSDEKQLKTFCPMFNTKTFEQMIKLAIRTIFQQCDLHHFSVRCPNYQIQRDDFLLTEENHLQTLIFDVKVPVNFHAILTEQFALKHLENLRRFCLFTSDDFQMTELLFDRFSSMETIEMISLKSNLRRSVIKYIEQRLLPSTYRNLNEFSLLFATVDAQHFLKQLNKTIRSRFINDRPGFQFNVGLVSTERKSILYDHKHPIHRSFHSTSTSYSRQFSMIFPSYLNYFPLYNELNFDE